MRTLFVLACLSVGALGQTIIPDVSLADSPITFTLKEAPNVCTLRAKSDKAFVAWSFTVHGKRKPTVGNAPIIIAAPITSRCHNVDTLFNEFRDATDVGLTAEYVQFVDGSFWGSPEQAKALAARRQQNIDDLQKTPMSEMKRKYSLLRMTDDQIRQDIRTKLALAELHKSWLDALK